MRLSLVACATVCLGVADLSPCNAFLSPTNTRHYRSCHNSKQESMGRITARTIMRHPLLSLNLSTQDTTVAGEDCGCASGEITYNGKPSAKALKIKNHFATISSLPIYNVEGIKTDLNSILGEKQSQPDKLSMVVFLRSLG